MDLLRPRTWPSRLPERTAVKCAICSRTYSLATNRWRVCDLCNSWVCNGHVTQHPTRLCPCCPTQLQDFLGGSDAATLRQNNLETTPGVGRADPTQSPYADATEFYAAGHWRNSSHSKCTGVVASVMRLHEELLREFPLAVRLLPDPSQRARLSKRQWEQVMFRSRNIIDLLHQKQDIVLLHFLHHEARKLSSRRRNILQGLGHPRDFADARQWRHAALGYAHQMHVLLAHEHVERSQAREGVRNDACLDDIGTLFACSATTQSAHACF